MAKPRYIIPGATYMITRRASQRTFRLRPHPLTNQIALYCLARAAAKCGMLIHAVTVMSNHVHLVLTDPRGCLPDFLREFHRSLAKALNALQGQRENLWAAERTNAVLLPTLDDVVAEVAYTAANPVAAGLVEHPDEWPGVVLWKPATIVAQRPKVYFDQEGSAPELAEVRTLPPPGIGPDDWIERCRDAIAERVARARTAVAKLGMRFLGAVAVMKQSFLQRAKSYELKRGVNPVLAARDVYVRKASMNVQRQFRKAYAVALVAWRSGDRLAAFPFGTWWMRVHHRAEVLPPPQ